ncbi:hypothetical protein IT157_02300 [bacterium]|nr:hypothetical protein [bacterium]
MKQRSIILAVTCLWFLSAAVVALGPLSCAFDRCCEEEEGPICCCVSGEDCDCTCGLICEPIHEPILTATLICVGSSPVHKHTTLTEGIVELPIRPPIAAC